MIEAKDEFRKVSVQVFLANVVVDAHYAPLNDRVERLRAVRVDVAAHVLFSAMAYHFVAWEVVSQPAIGREFVRDDIGVFVY